MKSAQLLRFAWVISVLSVLLAVIAWGQGLDWQKAALSSYTLFPLLGLVAYSLMWAHYMVATARKYAGLSAEVTKKYFDQTSFIVLLAICLHPGILIVQLWRDDMGLPPNSYLNYVGPTLQWAVGIGSVSLLIFIIYEFRRKFNKKSWWKFVQYASDVAMIGIFVHALRLGSNIQSGWFQYVWYFYGITLVASIAYMYFFKQKTATK